MVSSVEEILLTTGKVGRVSDLKAGTGRVTVSNEHHGHGSTTAFYHLRSPFNSAPGVAN